MYQPPPLTVLNPALTASKYRLIAKSRVQVKDRFLTCLVLLLYEDTMNGDSSFENKLYTWYLE